MAQATLVSQIIDEAPGGFVLDESTVDVSDGWTKRFLLNGQPLQIRAAGFETPLQAVVEAAAAAVAFGSTLDDEAFSTHPVESDVVIVEGGLGEYRFLGAFYVEGSVGFRLVYPVSDGDDRQRFQAVLIAQLAHSDGERGRFPADLLERLRTEALATSSGTIVGPQESVAEPARSVVRTPPADVSLLSPRDILDMRRALEAAESAANSDGGSFGAGQRAAVLAALALMLAGLLGWKRRT